MIEELLIIYVLKLSVLSCYQLKCLNKAWTFYDIYIHNMINTIHNTIYTTFLIVFDKKIIFKTKFPFFAQIIL